MAEQAYPPGPSLIRMFFMYAAARGNSLHLMQRLTRRYGDAIHLSLGGRHYYVFNHPDYIEDILMAADNVKRSTPEPMQRALGNGLICSSEDHHRRIRAIIQPVFQKLSPKDMAATILGYAQQQTHSWKDRETRNIEEEMIHLTLGVILKMVFGTDFGDAITAFPQPASRVHENGNATAGAIINTLLERLPLLGPRLPLGKARRHLDGVIYRLIATRREEGQVAGNDLLSTLLRVQLYGSDRDRELVTDKVIRDEVITMLTAGHETISSALTWTWHLLAEHPEAEQKLHDELDTVLGSRQPSVEDLPRLQYTRMVFSESMRLYPPVWSAARRAMEALEVGGYSIPKGSFLAFTQYLIHRDARFHPEPDKFNPERFLPGEQAKRPKFSYFPFGAGTRQCIGEGFAWMEGLLLIAALAQQWRFHSVPSHPVEVEPLIALQPKFGIHMRLKKRCATEQTQKELLEVYGATV